MPEFKVSKLLEKIILPTIIVISVKIGSIFFLNIFFDGLWNLGNRFSGVNVLFFNFSDATQALWVNTLSDLFLIAVCAIGFLWVVFRSQHFTLEAMHPTHAVHLLQKEMHYFLTKPEDTLAEGIVWFDLTLMASFFIFINCLLRLSAFWVGGFALAVSLILGACLLIELKRVVLKR